MQLLLNTQYIVHYCTYYIVQLLYASLMYFILNVLFRFQIFSNICDWLSKNPTSLHNFDFEKIPVEILYSRKLWRGKTLVVNLAICYEFAKVLSCQNFLLYVTLGENACCKIFSRKYLTLQ